MTNQQWRQNKRTARTKSFNSRLTISYLSSIKTSRTSYFTYSRRRFGNVSGGNGFCWMRNCNFSKPSVGFCSMFMSAWLCSVTGSSSCSERGGMSVSATHAASSAKINQWSIYTRTKVIKFLTYCNRKVSLSFKWRLKWLWRVQYF